MALVKCPECGKDVSSKAAACPHCGHPINGSAPPQAPINGKKAKKKTPKGCQIGCLSVAVIFAIIIVLPLMDHAARDSNGTSSTTTKNAMTFPARVGACPVGMTLIPAGTNSGTNPDYGAYTVTVSNAFYMDVTEVTKSRWNEVFSWAKLKGYEFDNSESDNGTELPANVNWYAAVKWCNALSEKEERTPCYKISDKRYNGGLVYRAGQVDDVVCDFSANGYRLPTVAEWEYAARGGLNSKRFPWGDTIDHSKANYHSFPNRPTYDLGETTETMGSPIPVGSFPPNGYGLYDMVGNVWEWCWDIGFEEKYSFKGRCCRGGCFYFDPFRFGDKNHIRSPNSNGSEDGFRTVRY